MRVRLAYISSFGTTAILVVGALTLLAVGGAIFAFNGWPASAGNAGVQSVPIVPGAAPARTALVRRAPAAHRVVRKAPAHATRRASTAGLVKTAGPDKQFVSGLIMEPTHAAPPMAVHPLGNAQTPQSPAEVPESGPIATRDPGPDAPVPAAGEGLSIPSLDGSVVPVPEPIGTLVSDVLSGGPPPPMQLTALGIPLP
jgi:hypothetical protein